MAVAFDASSEFATWTTGAATSTHTPTGVPRGVVVGIAHGTASTDQITAVLYGGLPMKRLATCADTATEPGRSYLYGLGRNVPAGPQTVTIIHTGTTDVKWAATATVTAAADVEFSGGMWFAGDTTANISEFLFKARSGMSFACIYSGLAAPSDLTPAASITAMQDHDFGNFCARFDRETSPSTGLYNMTWTAANDDCAICTVSVSEVPTTGAHVVGGGVPFSTTPTTSQTLTYCGDMIDLDLYMFAVSRDSTSASADVTCTDNSGVGSWLSIAGDTDKKAWCWWKRGTAADVGATITVASAVGSCQIGIAVVARADGYRGNPTTALTLETNASGDETHASITVPDDTSSLLFAIYDYGNDTNAVTNMSAATSGALTMVLERLSSGGNDCRLTVGCDDTVTGATGNVTWTQVNSTTKTVLFGQRPSLRFLNRRLSNKRFLIGQADEMATSLANRKVPVNG